MAILKVKNNFSLCGCIYSEMAKGSLWIFSIFNKIFSIFPFLSVAVASLSLLSQLSVLFSYFLPLKILLVLSSEKLPSYFPSWTLGLGRQNIIVGLCVFALALYAAHHLFESINKRLVDIGVEKLDKNLSKVVLYENQSAFIKQFFQDFFKVIGNAVFFVISIILVGVLNCEVLIYVLISLTLCFLSPAVLVFFDNKFKDTPSGRISDLAEFLSASCFFFCFFCLVVQLSNASVVSILKSAVVILFLRQIFSKAAAVLKSIIGFISKRNRIDPVLFEGKKYHPIDDAANESFWRRFSYENYISEIDSFLSYIHGRGASILSCEWCEAGVRDVVSFKVVVAKKEDDSIVNYYIRIYHSKKMGLAKHESILYDSRDALSLPLVKPIWSGVFNGFYYLVFDVGSYRDLDPDLNRRSARFIRKALFFYRPSDELISRYMKSKPFVWQKIDSDFLERLKIISGGNRKDIVERFELMLPCIGNVLAGSPLALVNPDINSNTVFMKNENCFVCAYWGRWEIEPIGSGWSIDGNDFNILKEIALADQNLSARSAEVSQLQVVTAAFVYKIYDDYTRQKYSSCMMAMSWFIDHYEGCFKGELAVD